MAEVLLNKFISVDMESNASYGILESIDMKDANMKKQGQQEELDMFDTLLTGIKNILDSNDQYIAEVYNMLNTTSTEPCPVEEEKPECLAFEDKTLGGEGDMVKAEAISHDNGCMEDLMIGDGKRCTDNKVNQAYIPDDEDSGDEYDITDEEIVAILQSEKQEAQKKGVENQAYIPDDEDSGDKYDVTDKEIDDIIDQSEKKESQEAGLVNQAFIPDDEDSGDEYDVTDEDIDDIIAQSEEKEAQKTEPVNKANIPDDEDSGDEYDVTDEEIDDIIAQSEKKESQKTDDVLAADSISDVLPSNWSILAAYPLLHDGNQASDSLSSQSMVTLNSWIFKEDKVQAPRSALKKVKSRLGKVGRRLLKPFRVFKRCVRGNTHN